MTPAELKKKNEMEDEKYMAVRMWKESQLDPSNPDHIKILHELQEIKVQFKRKEPPFCYYPKGK
jgi:hypothetical protein